MSTFKNIQGRNIRSYTTNPDNPLEGQMWYNQTELKLKGVVASAAWSSGGPLATARRILGGAGTQTAALGFGGRLAPPPNANSALTEEYNGTGWAAGGALGTARFGIKGAGTQTAAVGFGGSTPITGKTEEYNGTAWSEQNDMGTARYSGGGFGIQTAAVMATGSTYPTTPNATEEYNGTSWTAGGNVGSARYNLAAAGIESAGLIFGGHESDPAGGNVGKTELWNGTSWSEEADLSGPVYYNGQAGAGTATAAISFGGEGSSNQMRTATEEWLGAGAPLTRTFTDS